MGLDIQLFQMINNLAGQRPWLDRLMILLVNDYFVPTTLSLLLFALWFGGRSAQGRRSGQETVCYAILALLLANLVVKLGNLLYFRPRPFAVHEVNLLFYPPTDSSFPSNPAAAGFALAAAVWAREWRLGAAMALLALGWGFARIYGGVHYPADVLAGSLIGVGAAFVVYQARSHLAPLVDFILALSRKLLLA